ncbi:MAG: tetratricopeptide repeat protein [Pseudomonadota bacterium]
MVARTLGWLGEAYRQLHRFDEAVPRIQRALAIYEKTLGADDPAVANTLLALARIDLALDRVDAAKLRVQRALAIYETTRGPGSAEVAARSTTWPTSTSSRAAMTTPSRCTTAR